MKTLALVALLLPTLSHADWGAKVYPNSLECTGSSSTSTCEPTEPERSIAISSNSKKLTGGKYDVSISYKLDGETHDVKAKALGASLGAMGSVDFTLYALNGNDEVFGLNSSVFGYSTKVEGDHNAFGWLQNCGGLAKHKFEFPAFANLGKGKGTFLVSCKATFLPDCKDSLGTMCKALLGKGQAFQGVDCSKNPNE